MPKKSPKTKRKKVKEKPPSKKPKDPNEKHKKAPTKTPEMRTEWGGKEKGKKMAERAGVARDRGEKVNC
ncbi:MAG: hypothetical protein GKR88_19370 [Flavobacteriaceae bacterium]|nr:MAG: hypothetical protein GKR88_19370 [Flavobacteriaceae bacterium]